ncbi:apolipoprotein N-acyltransferase [Erythrobacter sp. YT30]|uniref:apolipoprotein N-acyltransferase n=1 Tax=Erythrobacter sp. YT30 TaxID=1735012 RepID=UPI00076CB1BA|nr:apolipoprotein N-acyltransferase [Erythrobacter sp. YT30]KWV91207.1 apolipoprotein N-acyltransferase [Erythrobacter sp. YT30]
MNPSQARNPLGKIVELAKAWPKLTSIILGLITACGYPPLHAWWIALPALALAILHWHAAPNWKAALWRGYFFGWAHLTLANNWIATAFTYQAKMPEFLGWIAVPLLCIYLAVYPAIAVVAAHLLSQKLIGERTGVLAYGLLLAGAWTITEWVRGWAFTGYPWPPLGLIALGNWNTGGIAALLPWLGTYALSGLVVLIACLLAAGSARRPWLARAGYGALIVAGMVLPVMSQQDETDVRYALVQPLIPQNEMNDGSKFEEQFQRITDLTLPGNEEERLVLWPESAIPDYLEDGYPQRYYAQLTAGADPELARRRIGSVIGPKSTLLTGVVNLDIGKGAGGFPTAVTARNSVLGLNGEGEITHHYAKAHLVPYGEYLPLSWALEPIGLDRLTAGTIDYDPGPGPQTLDLGALGKAGIQICYEIVFPGEVADRNNRPDYIFNPSNDGWFGAWGPPQHLAQARLRAIEEGLPVLRSTTTGISAVIDASGVVRQSVPTGEAGRLDGFIPKVKAPTLFARLGHVLTLGWAVIFLLAGLGMPRLLALRETRS